MKKIAILHKIDTILDRKKGSRIIQKMTNWIKIGKENHNQSYAKSNKI